MNLRAVSADGSGIATKTSLVGGGCMAADEVECTNCSVRSLVSFMFYHLVSASVRRCDAPSFTDLCTEFQYVFESHAGRHELALQ